MKYSKNEEAIVGVLFCLVIILVVIAVFQEVSREYKFNHQKVNTETQTTEKYKETPTYNNEINFSKLSEPTCSVLLTSDETLQNDTFEIDIEGIGEQKTQLTTQEYLILSNVMMRMFPYKPLVVK